MRITRLLLENIRCFEHVEFTDIPSTVLLVSPNGGGKSTVLEVLAGVHQLIQPYHKPRYQFKADIEGASWAIWPSHLRDLLRRRKDAGRIEIDVESTEGEEQYLREKGLQGKPGSVVIEVFDQRRVRIKSANGTIEELFKFHPTDDGVGRIDQIRPVRIHPTTTHIGNVGSLTEDQTRQLFSEFHRGSEDQPKYHYLKTFVYATLATDFAHQQRTGELRKSLAPFVEVFDHLLAPKRFSGLHEERVGKFNVFFSMPSGIIDLDLLSDGEKEIMNIMGHLFRFRELPNVVLWDTPESHLNAALESRLYEGIRRVAPDNQYWIATHSIEIIDSVPPESLYVLKQEADAVTLDHVMTGKRSEKLRIYRELGAQIGAQLVATRIAFVEGESDEFVLRQFAPDLPSYARFVDSRGVRNLRGVVDQLIEVSDEGDFCAISDRDDLSDADITSFEAKKPGSLRVWRKREIENYLLDDEAIWTVIEEWGSIRSQEGNELRSINDVRAGLRASADSSMNDVVTKKIERRLSNLRKRLWVDPNDMEGSLMTAYNDRQQALETIAPDQVAALISEVTRQVNDFWARKWRDQCLGKETIDGFLTTHFKEMNTGMRRTFKERICKVLCDEGRIPEEIQSVIDMIK